MTIPGRGCCYCQQVCGEVDDAPSFVNTHIAATITLNGMATALGFSQSPLHPPGGGAATPATISGGEDLEGYELTLGGFQCGRQVQVGDYDCMFRALYDAVVAADAGDGLELGMFYPWSYSPGPIGDDEYPDYKRPYPEAITAAAGLRSIAYAYTSVGGGSFVLIGATAALVCSKNGQRYAIVFVSKYDGSNNFADNWPPEAVAGTPGYSFAPRSMQLYSVGIHPLSAHGRVLCDGLEVEIPMTPLANTYGHLRYPLHSDMKCQSDDLIAGRPLQEAITGPTSVTLKLFRY